MANHTIPVGQLVGSPIAGLVAGLALNDEGFITFYDAQNNQLGLGQANPIGDFTIASVSAAIDAFPGSIGLGFQSNFPDGTTPPTPSAGVDGFAVISANGAQALWLPSPLNNSQIPHNPTPQSPTPPSFSELGLAIQKAQQGANALAAALVQLQSQNVQLAPVLVEAIENAINAPKLAADVAAQNGVTVPPTP